MDFINERRVLYPGDVCSQCGNIISPPASGDLRLCSICLEERHRFKNALRINVRAHFNLRRSPRLRNCFLKLLISHGIDLEPSGWRTGMALACELKGAGFAAIETERVLIHAGGKAEKVRKLLEIVYRNAEMRPLTCEQIKDLDLACHECPQQFQIKPRECVTEIF